MIPSKDKINVSSNPFRSSFYISKNNCAKPFFFPSSFGSVCPRFSLRTNLYNHISTTRISFLLLPLLCRHSPFASVSHIEEFLHVPCLVIWLSTYDKTIFINHYHIFISPSFVISCFTIDTSSITIHSLVLKNYIGFPVYSNTRL